MLAKVVVFKLVDRREMTSERDNAAPIPTLVLRSPAVSHLSAENAQFSTDSSGRALTRWRLQFRKCKHSPPQVECRNMRNELIGDFTQEHRCFERLLTYEECLKAAEIEPAGCVLNHDLQCTFQTELY